jgi:hypothetical protein
MAKFTKNKLSNGKDEVKPGGAKGKGGSKTGLKNPKKVPKLGCKAK